MIGLLILLDPQPGSGRAVGPMVWLAGLAVNTAVIAVLFLVARACRGAVTRAALLGTASGLGYGLTAALTKGFTARFAHGGVAAVLSSWQLYACGVAGIVSLWLLENAYHAGPLAAAQPGITLADPLVATTWGVFIFGEPIRSGPVLALLVLPAAALTAGAAALIRSPRLQALQAADADGAAAQGTGAAHGPQETGGGGTPVPAGHRVTKQEDP